MLINQEVSRSAEDSVLASAMLQNLGPKATAEEFIEVRAQNSQDPFALRKDVRSLARG